MAKEKILTIEEFKEKCNNFFLYFIRFESYINKPHFIKFKNKCPELERKLTEDYTPINEQLSNETESIMNSPQRLENLLEWKKQADEVFKKNKEILKPFIPRFYEAYKIMREYVDSDRELFS